MMQRISGPLIIIAFALIALLWPMVHSIPWQEFGNDKVVVQPTPSPDNSQVERVIEFCMDEKNVNSKLCIVENPKTVDDLKEAVTPLPQIRSGSRDPIVVRERDEERSTRTIVNNNTRPSGSSPNPPSSPRPTPEQERSIEVPVPADVELPVDVPEIEAPIVGKVKITESDPILPADE
jgi:hypothetical protein